MIRKSTNILLIIFITLLFYWIISELENWSKDNYKTEQINNEKINTIKINKNNKNLYLIKNKNGWTINNMPIREERINIIFEKLNKTSNKSLISKKTYEKEIYGINKKTSTQIECMNNGKIIYTLDIGKRSKNLNSNYVMINNKNIYLLDFYILQYISNNQKDYIDYRITHINTDEIHTLKINNKNRKTIIYKQADNKWYRNKNLVSNKQTKILNSFIKANAQEIQNCEANDLKKLNLLSPNKLITIELKTKQKIYILIGKKTKQKYYLYNLNNKTIIYKINESLIEKLETTNY